MKNRFSVACPGRTVCNNHAAVFAKYNILEAFFCGTQRGSPGIPGERTYLNLNFGYWTAATRRLFPPYPAEWLRSAAHPLFDRWVMSNLKPGTNLLTSYGYANRSMQWVTKHGGLNFLDAGNSHPAQFWEIIADEHKRWRVSLPPMPPHWNQAGRKSTDFADYFFCSSQYVQNSFLERGVDAHRLLYLPYPVDLDNFCAAGHPASTPTQSDVLRVICTGSISLRKGMPYLLEAMRIVQKHQKAKLVLIDHVESSMKSILPRYADVAIEWVKVVPHAELPSLLRSAHVFAILSLEEGMVRTALEAMACGLPVVLTPNTGANDYVTPGVNGEVVPIRDPQAAADAILKCYRLVQQRGLVASEGLLKELAFPTFENRLTSHLQRIGCLPT